MKLVDLLDKFDVELLTPEEPGEISVDLEITGGYCGDLLSNVMAHAKAGDIWLTIQTHLNIIAVAVLLNLPCIILTEGNMPRNDTLQKAKEEGVIVLSSSETSYQIAGRLYSLGLGR